MQRVLMSEQGQMSKVHPFFALAVPKAIRPTKGERTIIVAARNTRYTGAL